MNATGWVKRVLAAPFRRGPVAERRRRRGTAARIAAAGPAGEVSFAVAVESRSSVRRFLDDPVPRADVERMVALATRAASAGNAQNWRFVAVEDAAVRQRMGVAVEQRLEAMAAWPEAAALRGDLTAARGYSTFFAEAPLVVVVCALPYESRIDRLLLARGLPAEERDRLRQHPDMQSVGAAVQLFITAAHVLGYGACWMSAPVVAAEQLERILEVEPPARLVALVPVGRPAQCPAPRSRLPVREVLRFR